MIDNDVDALLRADAAAHDARLESDLDLLARVRSHPACATLIDALEDELASFGTEIPEYGEELKLALQLLSPGGDHA